MENLPEAPISVTFKVKSPNGFEHLLTLRDGATDESFASLMSLISRKEKVLLDKGFTPLSQNVKFPPKQTEYVPDKSCPECGSRLIKGQSKDGTKKFEKCEKNKYNWQTKQQEGCPFINWMNQNSQNSVPERQIHEDGY